MSGPNNSIDDDDASHDSAQIITLSNEIAIIEFKMINQITLDTIFYEPFVYQKQSVRMP